MFYSIFQACAARALRAGRLRTCFRAPARSLGAAALVIALSVTPCHGQVPDADRLTDPERSGVVERMVTLLEERYVFAELGLMMADSLRRDLREGTFSGVAQPEAFAATLSDRIRGWSGDGHLWVVVDQQPAEPVPQEQAEQAPQEQVPPNLRRANFGFPRAEILPGNVGYLDIRQFVAPAVGGPTLASAMGYLANTEALVLDLRRSMGGSQDMVALLASYLFPAEPRVHLFDSYHRPSDRNTQSWTLSYLSTPRFVDRPVYVLTAARTFSAGEGLAYLLQQTGRAEVVGEQTAGGANPGAFHRLGARFVMFVAEAQVTSPVSGANWEGTGVRPDVHAPADVALEHAHGLAVQRIRDTEGDDERRRELDELLGVLRGG